MVRGQYFITMENFMKENLKIIRKKDLDRNYIQTDLSTKANLKKIRETEKEDLNGQMDKFMMANGLII